MTDNAPRGEQTGERTAAIMSDTGVVLSYADLETQSVRLSHLLRANGLVEGDRVAVIMENDLAWFVAMWGVRRANMFFVPVNWHLTPAEIRYVVENSDARAIITSARLLDLAREASDGLPGIAVRLAVGADRDGFWDFADALRQHSDSPLADERDGGSMLYSSGTTGQPKGILRDLTDDRFGTPNSLERMLHETYAIEATTVYLSPAPIYHASPIGFTGTVLVNGGTIVMMPSFDAEAALAAIERYRVTHAQFVPTHLIRMLRLPDAVKARYDLSSLRVLVHAAAPCPPDVKRAVIDWFGPIVFEYYAGSERAGFTAIDSAEWLAHPGSVGRSRTGAIHILNLETGAELPNGAVGAIYFENPVPFDYHKDPAKTAAAFSAQGWGTHGDVGHLDDDGYLYLSDRRSDLILSGGVNIYPQEIENVLAAHPAVADAAVIGIPDDDFGQQVRAIVQLLPSAPTPSEADLIAHCRVHLAGFKAPRSVGFTDALPRHPNGKLLRRRLIDDHRATPKEPA